MEENSKSRSGSSVYPANVGSDTQNRQQIATVLQSMGFETDDIEHAFNVFENKYGDHKYDIAVLTDIVFQQQNAPASSPNPPHNLQSPNRSRSAPNSPNLKDNNPFHPSFEEKSCADSILPIFNSMQLNSHAVQPPPAHTNRKACSASPQIHHMPRPSRSFRSSSATSPSSASSPNTATLEECLNAFKKYACDESEIIDVLLQTLQHNNTSSDVLSSLVNWNDLLLNIQHRQAQWNRFQQQYNTCSLLKDYDARKHELTLQTIRKHKSYKTLNKQGSTPSKPSAQSSVMQRALAFEKDQKQLDLLTKKDKLLVTANTYSILKNHKEKTELMIGKCNAKIDEINGKMEALQQEKKQYVSALLRTKNKLLFQTQSIKDTESSIKELHESTNKVQRVVKRIEGTAQSVVQFETRMDEISDVLRRNFEGRLEPKWRTWSTQDVVIWMQHIENGRFGECDLSQLQLSGVAGKDLPQMNEFILRSFKIAGKADREIILRHIARVIKLKDERVEVNGGHAEGVDAKKQLCVVCSDGEANNIMIPCGHIAVCSTCVARVEKYKKCPFCGGKISNIIKCFHVGI